ncbi:MAG: hypothetical protein PHF18_14490 [Methanosarcina sp.]|uniref:hypothetical protein n=1 Tax=Methanosarcina sp. TaxID=2213 RepID=UPI0026320B0C|nr:hypothetical protein [Methanosarcina sp.]MDD3248037.1 hypothetical protein [Methanosarcina sp.]MDD4249102.1 hypothetical protein [Methanosarcina sp.]
MISPCRLPTCLLMKAKKGLLESSLRTIAPRSSLGTIAPRPSIGTIAPRSCRLHPVFHRCQCFMELPLSFLIPQAQFLSLRVSF